MKWLCRSMPLLAFGTLSCALPLAGQQPGSVCQPNDVTKQNMVTWAKGIASGSDSLSVATRNQLHIPAVAATQVTPVTDDKICHNIAKAYSVALGMPSGTIRSMYVVKVGTSYVARDPAAVFGEWVYGMVLDRQYNVLSKFTS